MTISHHPTDTLMSTTHTPGPWTIKHEGTYSGGWLEICGQDGDFTIAETGTVATAKNHMVLQDYSPGASNWKDTPEADEIRANARLIAAAPDLYALHDAEVVHLDCLLKAVQCGDPQRELELRITDLIAAKRAAIAKA